MTITQAIERHLDRFSESGSLDKTEYFEFVRQTKSLFQRILDNKTGEFSVVQRLNAASGYLLFSNLLDDLTVRSALEGYPTATGDNTR